MYLDDPILSPASARTFRYWFELADDPTWGDPFEGVRPEYFLHRDFAAKLGLWVVRKRPGGDLLSPVRSLR